MTNFKDEGSKKARIFSESKASNFNDRVQALVRITDKWEPVIGKMIRMNKIDRSLF